MKLECKLPHASYCVEITGQYSTVKCTTMGMNKERTEEKEQTYDLGYFGPFQLENAFLRIISEEQALGNDTIAFKEFLKRYNALTEKVIAEVTKLRQELKEAKLNTVEECH